MSATVLPADWMVTYDGRGGDEALTDALRAGRFPVVEVLDATGRVVASGRPGSERRGVAALEDVRAGCDSLLRAACHGRPLLLPDGALPEVGRSRPVSRSEQALRVLAGATVRGAGRMVLRTPHWRVGWRWTGAHSAGALSGALAGETDGDRGGVADGWRDLPDDGHHFYADPFPVLHEGRTYVFVEDFDHRVGRAVISVVEFGADGPLGVPTPVLAGDVHLSYPVVLADAGQLWMIPETSAAGTVELYRATAFPHRWERYRVLLRGIDANDVTPFRHDGRWWLSGTVRHGGSCSDSLHLWHADALEGPWTPHAANPVVIDIASARSGGHVQRIGSRLLRPAQDGRAGYGAALTIAEIVHLDPQRYEQRIIGHLAPGIGWSGRRLHTLNRAGRLEVIDGSARSWRRPW